MNNLKVLKEKTQIKLSDQVRTSKNIEEEINKYKTPKNPFIFSTEEFINTPFDEIDINYLDSNNDFLTAKYLFETIKIDRIQASDQRLWTTLTHTV